MRVTKFHIRDYRAEEVPPGSSAQEWRANLRWLRREQGRRVTVYVHCRGETIVERFGNRVARPWREWRPVVEAELRARGIPLQRLRWDQHAGCSVCPCSPGFVVEGGERGYAIWITVEGGRWTTDPELSAQRSAALLQDPTIRAAEFPGMCG